MGGTKTCYSDQRFGAEHILISPNVSDLSAVLASSLSAVMNDDYIFTELGVIAAEAITLVSVCSFHLKVGATTIGTLLIPSGLAIGDMVTTITLTTNASAVGDKVTLQPSVTTAGTGTVFPFFRYREVFQAT